MKAAPETLSPEQAAFLVRQRVARLARPEQVGASQDALEVSPPL